MDRRQFVKDVLLWTAGLSLGVPCLKIFPVQAAPAAPVLGVAKGKDYRLLVVKAVEIAGGIGAFVKTGDTVVIKPNMTVIDATRILLRNGPQGGRREDVKIMDTVIVSSDPVAADAYATTLFDMQPHDITSTLAAYQMGLGEMDIGKMEIKTVQV